MAYRSNLRTLGLSTTALTLVMSISYAVAQTTPATPPTGDGVETVTVTGSLLNNPNFTAPTPVTAVSSATIDDRALTGIGTLVSQLPFAQAGGGLVTNTNGINGVGESFPNLRGLGTIRTLVLVDGQRLTPENQTNNFDTDLIPSSLIQRFDVVTTGASASYGSDAVAGVVNFVLKDNFEGFSADLRYGISQRGDNDQPYGSFAYGTTFLGGKLHFLIGGEATGNSDAVTSLARTWGQQEPGLVTLPTSRSAGLPSMVFTNHAEFDAYTPGGLITSGPLKGTAFSANGTPYNFAYGAPATIGSPYMIGTGNYGVSSLNRDLNPPYSRETALARVQYDITPDTNAFLTVNYGILDSDATSQAAPIPETFIISSGNPYIPASVQSAMTADKLTTISVAKEQLDGLGNIADDQNTLLQSMFGAKGRLFDDWAWDFLGNWGKSVRSQGFNNIGDDANAYEAANAVVGPNGTPVCGPVATAATINAAANKAQLLSVLSPNCVPFNVFGTTSVVAKGGQPTSNAAINYIMNPTDANGNYVGTDSAKANIRQLMFSGDVKGSPLSLPAGEVDLAVGGNWRQNSYNQFATKGSEGFYYDSLNNQTYKISESVWETYAEVGIPVLKDLPYVQALDVSAAIRYTDYSISGGVVPWKYGATWDINDEFRLRGTYSQDIRAPNFSDLTPLPINGASNITNPISGLTERLSTINTGGNDNLKPELAKNLSAGLVFNSDYDWLPGFHASVDYYRINISGVIASVAAQDVVNRCLGTGLQQYCNQIQFTGSNVNTTFAIAGLNLLPLNLNNEIQDGFDLNFNEHLPLDDYNLPGVIDFSALGSYVNEQRIIQINDNGSISNINYADTTTAPRWSWNATLGYSLDQVSSSLQLIYYSPIEYSALNQDPTQAGYIASSGTSINRNIWPAALTWNLHLAYDLFPKGDSQKLQAYLNIDNLLDKDPPLIWQYVSNYDVLGRYFRLGVRYNTN